MKVAHFINSRDPGGAETLILDMCTYSNMSNVDSFVIAFPDSWIAEQCKVQGITCIDIPKQHFWKTFALPLFVYEFSKFLKKLQIDVIHTHLYGASLRGIPAATFANIGCVCTLHDTMSIEEKPVRLRHLKRVCGKNTQVVAISNNVKHAYLDSGGFKAQDIQVIYNGIKLNNFTRKDSNLKSKLKIPADHVVLLTAGRLSHEKGIDVLLHSLQFIKSKIPYTLLIAGEGEERENLKQINTDNNVVFLGYRKDIPELMSISDCYISPSRQEGLGISIQQAMAANLPVVATNVGGVSELVTHQENGILIPSETPVEMAKAITVMLTSPTSRKLYGAASRWNINTFSFDRMWSQYFNLYSNSRRQ